MFKTTKLALAACALVIGSQALAVPELRETRADFHNSLATIMPDNQDPNAFYFLPDVAGFAKNQAGLPMFGLVLDLNNPDPSGPGGVMNFVFKAGISDELKAELAEFRKTHPTASLSVVPFGKSTLTMGLSQDLTNGRIAQALKNYVPEPGKPVPADLLTKPRALGAIGPEYIYLDLELPPNAGVAETQVGGNALLTKWGAQYITKSIENPVGTTFQLCYQVYGALPTMQAHIHLDYQKTYEYMRASASGGWLFWGWSMSSVVEKLHQQHVIDWKITGGTAKDEDYVKKFAADLIKDYLKPQLTNAPGASGYTPQNAVVFGFDYTKKEERETLDADMTVQSYITDDRCVTVPMNDLKKYKKDIIQKFDR